MVVRGYRMSEVDAVLERLAEELAVRDERVADLERVLAEIVAPVVDEAEAQRTDEPVAAQGAAEIVEAPVPASPPSLTPTLAQGARAGEAPAQTPAPALHESSPAAAFTMPSDVTSPRVPLVVPEPERQP